MVCLQTELTFQKQFQIKNDILDYRFDTNKMHGKEGKFEFFTDFYPQNDSLINQLF